MEIQKYVAKRKSEIAWNPKGWIELKWGGIIDKEEFADIAGRMVDRVSLMKDEFGYSLLLIDFSGLGEITEQAAVLAINATRDLGARKIAGYSIKPQFMGMLNLIKERSEKADTIRDFAIREDAESWLMRE